LETEDNKKFDTRTQNKGESNMTEMRRQDRLMNPEDTIKVLQDGEYGLLATVDGSMQPYGVPVNYVFLHGSIYFHSTNAGGQKYTNIVNNPKVCFTVVGMTKVLPEQFGTLYESAIVYGTTELIEDEEERLLAFREFVKKYSANFLDAGEKYIKADGKNAMIVRINISEITGKHRV
jgi:uncharacterized protein